ncbi:MULTISPECIES: hypothetical protein [unclassified Synechocystis]|uniref:hypothetical protein n=1 Tax=unclassified Synechocystis TaxID=2640012 RepID=UPI00040253AD|nr:MULTISPECIES: hypothetical protein [unclassified Synechocystis]AIE74831.1 hypothetical protein D082_23030 [Synechocystis sp. PCC 6714]MCT0253444.1 hypothetical protein [Synechocystis sp. CS-94]
MLPEKEGIITRIHHCVIAGEVEGWLVIDQSTNGTIIKRQGQRLELNHQMGRKLPIASEDVIWIHHWQLKFIDPSQTNQVVLLRSQVTPAKPPKPWVFNIN